MARTARYSDIEATTLTLSTYYHFGQLLLLILIVSASIYTLHTMRQGNIQVFIKSQPEGRVLPEYQVETLDGGKTVVCYIPSEVGMVRTLR